MTVSPRTVRSAALTGLILALLGGCSATTFDTFPTTAQVVEQGDLLHRGPPLTSSTFQAAVDQRIAELVAQPLDLQSALEIAVLNQPRLQGIYLAQNVNYPSFVEKLAAARASDPGTSVEWAAVRLALLPAVNRMSRYEFAEAYAGIAPEFVTTAEHIKKEWYAAVAAHQTEAMMRQVVDALRAQAELANEQYRSGTVSRGEQAKRHIALGSVLKEHAAAKRELVEAREALVRHLGLWGDLADIKLPDRLPDLPAEAAKLDGIEDYALANRMDVVAARHKGGAWSKAVAARSQAREAYANYLTAYDTAKYQRDVVMPLTQVSLEFAQQEYNGMLIGVYDLLAEVQEQIEAGKDYIETLRDFWTAEAELISALGGSLPGRSASSKGSQS